MGRIRRIEGHDEETAIERPMVIKSEEKSNGNGYIPVKYEDVEVWYSSSDGTYFAVVRIEGKKHRFELVK